MRRGLMIAGLLIAAPAHAQPALFPNERPGFYLGGGAAFTNVTASNWTSNAGSSERGDSDYGFTANGGYRFNPYFALELAYLDGGTPEFNDSGFDGRVDTDVDLTAYQATAIGTLPLIERWELYLKLGIAAWDADSDQILSPAGNPQVFRRENRSGPSLLLGIGFGVMLTDHLHARLEYQSFEIDDELLALDAVNTGNDDASFDAATLQLHWRFGGEKRPEPLELPEKRRR